MFPADIVLASSSDVPTHLAMVALVGLFMGVWSMMIRKRP